MIYLVIDPFDLPVWFLFSRAGLRLVIPRTRVWVLAALGPPAWVKMEDFFGDRAKGPAARQAKKMKKLQLHYHQLLHALRRPTQGSECQT